MVAHSMELDELLFSSFFMDHGNNNEAKSLSSNITVLDANQRVYTIPDNTELMTELYKLCPVNKHIVFHASNGKKDNGYPIDVLDSGGLTGIFINNDGHWGMIFLFIQNTSTVYVARISNKSIASWKGLQ